MRIFRLTGLLIAAAASSAVAQLRIVDYNVTADNNGGVVRNGFSTVMQGIKDESVLGIVRPVDVMVFQESTSWQTTGASVMAALNTVAGSNIYASVQVNGAGQGGTQNFVYNTQTVQLIGGTVVGTSSSTGQPRQATRSQFRPVGYGSAADFYIYNSHTKASDTSADASRRNDEAVAIRANADALPAGSRIIYAGDLNTYRSTEPMLATLYAAGPGKAVDPLLGTTAWSGNQSTNRQIYTQAPLVSPPGGLVGGGIDDRFDWQLSNGSMQTGDGVSLIPGTYHTFMHNGSVAVNGNVTDSTNTASPSLPNRANVLTALTTASDHLPLMADYQIPAMQSVAVSTVPTMVIVGATVSPTVAVTNSAPVAVAIGADQLNYAVTSGGSLSGSGSGTRSALAGAGTTTLSLNTATPGVRSGTIAVNSTSVAVANGSFTSSVSTTVLAHAKPSFSAGTQTTSTAVDFGIRARGLTAPALPFAITNLADASGFTAKLDLTPGTGTGMTSKLTTTLAASTNLDPATSRSFTASLNTSANGTFSATYPVSTFDQNLPGAIARAALSVTVTGIVATAGDADLSGSVDSVDFASLIANFSGASPTWFAGDFNRDGSVNSTDFSLLVANYGTVDPVAGPGVVVPEPVAMIALVPLWWMRRRRDA